MLLCVLLGLLFCASVLAEGNYTVEEDGAKWYDDCTIVWPDGTVATQVDHDQGQKYDDDDGDSYTATEDGAMVVDTGEADPVAGRRPARRWKALSGMLRWQAWPPATGRIPPPCGGIPPQARSRKSRWSIWASAVP